VIHHLLEEHFPNSSTRRHGAVEWALRSPDLILMDFSFWGYIKSHVYDTKIQNREHLTECIREKCVVLRHVHTDFRRWTEWLQL